MNTLNHSLDGIAVDQILSRLTLLEVAVSAIRNDAHPISDGTALDVHEGARPAPVLVNPDPILHERALTLLRLMTPYGVKGYEKVRIGSSHDGGYVCIDDFTPIRTYFSFGVGGNDSADLNIGERGIQVFQFDHTVDRAPSQHENLHFFKEQIVPYPREGARTLEELLDQHDHGDHSVMLKIDIEQDEWPVLAAMPASALKPLRQITGEFHGLDFIGDDDYYERVLKGLQKLNENFFVCHVHANNYAPLMIYGGVMIPAVFELTYANRAIYEAVETSEVFPTSLDQACNASFPDYMLGSFRY